MGLTDPMFINYLARERQRALLTEAKHDRLAHMARMAVDGQTSAFTRRMLAAMWRYLRHAIRHVVATGRAERVTSPISGQSSVKVVNR